MALTVQRNVDIVGMENSVTMSTGLAPMDVRLGISQPAVKQVYCRENKHRQKFTTFLHIKVFLKQEMTIHSHSVIKSLRN